MVAKSIETTSSVSSLKIELSTEPVSASQIKIAAFFAESAVINLLSFSGSHIVETAVIVLHYILLKIYFYIIFFTYMSLKKF